MLAKLLPFEVELARIPQLAPAIALERDVVGKFQRAVSAIAFWSAVGLPLVYLPLMAQGIDSVSGLGFVLGLIELHVVALLFGQDHRIESG